jgi:hypothetical protein
VEELTPTKATLVTLAGHPLAGAIRFLVEQRSEVLRFEVQVYDRPANLADWVSMRAVGEPMQTTTWESLVLAMVAESGGTPLQTVQHEETVLDETQAERVEEWIRDLVILRKREQFTKEEARRRDTGRSAGGAFGTEATL